VFRARGAELSGGPSYTKEHKVSQISTSVFDSFDLVFFFLDVLDDMRIHGLLKTGILTSEVIMLAISAMGI